jgi:hypothetical protein
MGEIKNKIRLIKYNLIFYDRCFLTVNVIGIGKSIRNLITKLTDQAFANILHICTVIHQNEKISLCV